MGARSVRHAQLPDETFASDVNARPIASKRSGANSAEETDPAEEMRAVEMDLPAARIIERVDPLTLDPDELDLLDLLGPPLLVATPRAAKRLANSYGLLTAIRRDQRAADLAEQHAMIIDPETGERHSRSYRPYRAGMVLLAALIAYPELGPALFLHLHHTSFEQPEQSWAQFCLSLQPHLEGDGWQSVADPHMTPVQAQQWRALVRALDHANAAAAESELPLPEPLAVWGQWVIPVGRLSFLTGRIVSTLERQRPLSARWRDETS